ncbi:uncharacterized protein LOC121644337 isoform X2 [Melanotaenia boesemani]|uniref:uncharacterized protein LOC121644337 isoform X1 n=1 Tax=Melanotaenia boesemani TaxID=1250792 RepID=UPI001C05C783|nr:uncharacterized protein LOC121644337 isoform X1 [Melanotaenia boesemani]XP_041848162.1 uncharacterized protein LOC121644337 isoform X2 [Melanotaenia boesemani]
MACRVSRGRIISLCLGLLVFMTSHYHCTPLTRLKALDELKGNSLHIPSQAESQSQQHHGRLLIGQISEQDAKLNATNSTNGMLDDDSDYQADMGWWQNKELGGQDDGSKPDIAAVQRVLKLDPKVECTGNSMKLLVQDAASTPASLLFVDRGHLSPLSLSKLPSSCGYSIRSTRTELILIAPYDGCFVIHEEDSYVLPLRWWGLPVRMSCPLMRHTSSSPPMVTCHADGMVVKTDWTNSASRIKVKVNGNWELLLKASQRCMFGIVEHPEGVVLSVHYSPCLEKQNGLYTLELFAEGETKISCPALLPVHPQSAQVPAKGPQIPQNPQIPNKPGQGPTEIHQPYSPFPSFVYPNLARPNSPPAYQQMSQTPPPQISQSAVKPQLPAQSPVTKSPGQSKVQDQTQLHQFCAQTFQDPNLQQQCLQTLQQKPGDLYPPFYLFYLQQQPASKPTGVSKPQQPGATQGHMYQPFYPLYTQPKPVPKPADVPQSKPGTPPSYMYQPFYPLYTQPKPVPKPADVPQSKPGTPPSYMYPPFYPLYTQPKPVPKPADVPQSKPGTPPSYIYPPFYPLYTQPKPVPKPAGTSRPLQPETPPDKVQQDPGVQMPSKPPQPQQPETSRDQMYKPFYPYIYYTRPKPAVKPTGVSQSSQPVTTWSQVQQPPQPKPGDYLGSKPAVPYPEAPPDQWDQQMCFSAQLMAQSQLANKPSADQKPSTENMQRPFYGPCQPSRTPGTGTNYATSMESSRQNSQMSILKPPHGQMGYPSNQVYHMQAGNVGISPYAQPFYCPQLCPSGLGNCCIQIALHQHLHIFPAGFEGKDSAPFYPGLPLSAVAYAELGNGLEMSPFPQLADITMQATGTGISAQTSPQLLTVADKKQPHGKPADGNPAVLPGSSPSSTAKPQVLVYPYFPTDSLYPHWPYLPQNMDLQQGQSSAPSDPTKQRVSSDVPLIYYGPYSNQYPKQSNQLGGNNPFGANFMSVEQFSPRSAEQRNKPAGNEKQSLNKEFSGYKQDIDQLFFPFYMHQDAPALTQNVSLTPNNSQAQPFERDSKNSTKPEQSLGAHSAPQSYVLLQHGPPGREQKRFSDSPVPFRDLVHGTNPEALNLGQHHINPLNFEFLQEKGQQQLKRLGEGTFNSFPGDIHYMQRLDESGFPSFSSTLDKLHQMHLPPEQSPSAKQLKPETLESFEDPWKSLTPTSSSQKLAPHVPGKVFPQWSSMADQPANGKNQPLPTEHGDQKE